MVRIHANMRSADLPLPSDLTRHEVDELLDPEVKGVPELAPNAWLTSETERLTGIIDEGDEPAKGLAHADLSMRIAPSNSRSAEEHARNALEIGEALDDDRVLARAQCALGWAIYNKQSSHWRRALELALESEYKLHELKLPEWEAQSMLLRLTMAGVSGQFSGYTGLEKSIHDLLRSTDEPRDNYIWLFAAARHSLVLAYTARLSLNDEDLARRYLALDVLIARAVPEPLHIEEVHEVCSRMAMDAERWADWRRHIDRAVIIAKAQRASEPRMFSLFIRGQGLVGAGDLVSARETVGELRALISAIDPEDSQEMWYADDVEYAILKAEKKWREAEALLDRYAPRAMRGYHRNIIGIAKAYIEIYQAQGTMHEHLDVYENLVKELERERDERGSAQLRAATLMQNVESTRRVQRADEILKGVLPSSVYEEVVRTGDVAARYFPMAVLFLSDFAGFTRIASALTPRQVIEELSDMFGNFDRIMEENGCERIETIGDGYLAVAGLKENPATTAAEPATELGVRMVRAALQIQDYLAERNARTQAIGGSLFHARIGLHAGPILGGLVGRERLRYGIFGDPTNTVQRFEAACVPGRITVSESVYKLLSDGQAADLALDVRESIEAKGKGSLKAWEVRWADKRESANS